MLDLPSTSTSRPLVGQRLVRQQARHAQRRVRRQHAKLRGQRGLEAVLAVEFRGEFLGGFVAEGIADDDEGSPVVALLQPGPDVAVVEARAGSAPCRSATWPAARRAAR